MVFAPHAYGLLISEKSFHGRHNVGMEVTEKHGDLAVRVPV
jgi:hypothetical protein